MKRGERGFTLIEILIAIAITGAIIAPLLMTTTSLLTNPQRSNDQNITLNQVQNAGYRISRDVHTAKTVTPGTSNVLLTLTIPVDTNPSNDYEIDYVFEGSKLMRKQYDSSHTLVSKTLISDYIVTDNTTFSITSEGFYRLTIKASKGNNVVTMNYEITQRCSSS